MTSKEKLKILSWIEDPERTAKQGIKLYAEFGRKQFISRTINRLQNDDKIIAILDVQFKLMLGLSVLPPQVDAPVKQKVVSIDKNIQKEDSDAGIILASTEAKAPEFVEKKELSDPFPEDKRPDVLKEIYEKKNAFYVEAKNIFSIIVAKGDEMEKFAEDSAEYKALADERKPMAFEVIKLYDQVNDCWKQIDSFAEHGKLPEVEDAIEKPEIKADDEDPIAMDKRWRTIGTYISKAKKNPERNQEKLAELYAESNAIAEKLNALASEEKYKMRKYETPTDPGTETTNEDK